MAVFSMDCGPGKISQVLMIPKVGGIELSKDVALYARIPRCVGLLESVFRAIVKRSRSDLLTISWLHHSRPALAQSC